LVDDAGFGHFSVKVVAFTRAFAHTREHGHAAVQLGNVVDQFHDNDGFANARARQSTYLAAF